jgi:hypothetical protein
MHVSVIQWLHLHRQPRTNSIQGSRPIHVHRLRKHFCAVIWATVQRYVHVAVWHNSGTVMHVEELHENE